MVYSYNPKLNNDFISEYNTKLNQEYIQNVSQNIVFCTVYRINTESMYEHSSQAILHVIGEDSPLRFTKIYNYPLFNLESMEQDYSFSFETSHKPEEVSTSAVVIPIEQLELMPTVGTFIKLDYLDKNYLFEVKDNIIETNLENFKYRKVVLQLSKYSAISIIPQITEEKQYVFKTNQIVDKPVYDTLLLLKQYTEEFIKQAFIDIPYQYYPNRMYLNTHTTYLDNMFIYKNISPMLVNTTITSKARLYELSLFFAFEKTDINYFLDYDINIMDTLVVSYDQAFIDQYKNTYITNLDNYKLANEILLLEERMLLPDTVNMDLATLQTELLSIATLPDTINYINNLLDVNNVNFLPLVEFRYILIMLKYHITNEELVLKLLNNIVYYISVYVGMDNIVLQSEIINMMFTPEIFQKENFYFENIFIIYSLNKIIELYLNEKINYEKRYV